MEKMVIGRLDRASDAAAATGAQDDTAPRSAEPATSVWLHLSQPHDMALEAELRAGFARSAVRGKSFATQADTLQRAMRMFADLGCLGHQGLKARSIRTRHVDALLSLWRNGARDASGVMVRQPLTRASCGNNWRVLVEWGAAFGKGGMVPAFHTVWPTGQAPHSTNVARTTSRRRSCDLYLGLTDAEYQHLLARWESDAGKRTHYWISRAIRELGLKRRQAFLLEPRAASRRLRGSLVLKAERQRDAETIVELDTDAKKALVADLIKFVTFAGREKLVWPTQQVPTMLQAENKLKCAISHVLREFRASQRQSINVSAEKGVQA